MPVNSSTHSLDEQELLRRAHDFDEAALGAVFDIYYDAIYRYVFRHLRHEQTAEDITADVFRNFLENLNTRRGPSRFLKAWLYRVAHNLIVDEVRRNKYRTHETLDDDHQDESQQVSQQAERAFRNRVVRQAMNQLTDKQKDVLSLRYLQGLDNDEVAYVLNLNVGTVKALLHRGLQSMRRYFDQHEIGERDL